jgi:hypothetical protein
MCGPDTTRSLFFLFNYFPSDTKHFTTNGVHLNLVNDSSTGSERMPFDLLRQPVSGSVIVSRCLLPGLERQPSVALTAVASPIYFHMTTATLEEILSLSYSLSNIVPGAVDEESPLVVDNTHTTIKEQKIQAVTTYCHLELCCMCDAISLSLDERHHDDYENEGLTHFEKETMLEECLKDFVSQFACTNTFSSSSVVACLKNLCIDRLIALGLTEDAALYCVEQVSFAFLEDVELIDHAFTLEEEGRGDGEPNNDGQRPEDESAPTSLDPLGATEDVDTDIDVEEEGSMSSDGAQASRRGRDDAFDELELAMQNAVERVVSTILQFIDLSESNDVRHLLVLDVDRLKMNASQFFYETQISLEFLDLGVHNDNGLSFIKVRSIVCDDNDGDKDGYVEDVKEATSKSFNGDTTPVIQQQREKTAAIISVSLRDFVGDEEGATDMSISLAAVEMTIMPKAVSRAMALYSSYACLIPMVEGKARQAKSVQQNQVTLKLTGGADIISVLFVSDELSPFLLWKLEDVACKRDIVADGSDYSSRLDFRSAAFRIENLSQHGQAHPDLIYALEGAEIDGEDDFFSVSLFLSNSKWKCPSRMELSLRQANVIFLKQWVNELSSYALDSSQYFGELIHRTDVYDKNGNPPHPMKVFVTFHDSQIVFPRNSTSKDMLALRVHRLEIVKTYTEETWSSEDDIIKSPFDKPDCSVVYEVDEFFDCVEEESGSLDDEPELSTFHAGLFLRWKVNMVGLRMFTGLDTVYDRTKSKILPLFRVLRAAESGGSVFESWIDIPDGDAGLSPMVLDSILKLRWKEVTTKPARLYIVADYAPHLRILVRDTLCNKFDKVPLLGPLTVSLGISQFYLLLSVWYDNMQELPTFFPLAAETILEAVQVKECPDLYPQEFGSKTWTDYFKSDEPTPTFEMSMRFKSLEWMCIFEPNYFGKGAPHIGRCTKSTIAETPMNVLNAILRNFSIDFKTTEDGMTRVSMGSSLFQIDDERHDCTKFPSMVRTVHLGAASDAADTCPSYDWGLENGHHTLSSSLPFPFQATIVMTPDQWCLANIGFDQAHFVMENLDPVWILMEYFGLYFREGSYGNPFFRIEEWKKRAAAGEEVLTEQQAPLNLDVRLWCTGSSFSIPSVAMQIEQPALVFATDDGFSYRYQWLRPGLSIQEFCCKDMSVRYESAPMVRQGNQDAGVFLCSGLQLFAFYSYDQESNHSDTIISVPLCEDMLGENSKSLGGAQTLPIFSPRLSIPVVSVVGGQSSPSGHLGPHIWNISLTTEWLACGGMLKTFLGMSDSDEGGEKFDTAVTGSSPSTEPENASSQTYSFSAAGARCILCDPVLGTHCPVAALCLSSLTVQAEYATKASNKEKDETTIHVGCSMDFWIDYFNGTLKMWEPLVEPYNAFVLHESTEERGSGWVFHSDCNLHLNLSMALIETLEQALPSFQASATSNGEFAGWRNDEKGKLTACDIMEPIEETVRCGEAALQVSHRRPMPISENERIAFCLVNLTGQELRFHTSAGVLSTRQGGELKVSYLEDRHMAELSFDATYSIIQNLSMKEVPFDFFSSKVNETDSFSRQSLGVQVLGFRWIEQVTADQIGRHFHDMRPFSVPSASKIDQEWRLENALKLVTEVSLNNGGRQLSLMSPFKVVNKCTHAICVALHPDHTKRPMRKKESHVPSGCESVGHDQLTHLEEEVKPNDTLHIPFSLLESSLQLHGSLGCLWLAPERHCEDFEGVTGSTLSGQRFKNSNENEMLVDYSSKGVEFAKLVRESSVLHEHAIRSDKMESCDKSTSITASCPVQSARGSVSCPPVCYAVEVRRSSIVTAKTGKGGASGRLGKKGRRRFETFGDFGKTLKGMQERDTMPGLYRKGTEGGPVTTSNFEASNSQTQSKHDPVTYSLLVHPPFVIENLLPEGGTFELLHATRRQVVWSGVLEAGERVPIYSVGLDAPLFLLMNLGYCRTPNGEGALVHDGNFSRTLAKGTVMCFLLKV